MTEDNDVPVCHFCRKGRLIMKMEEIAFQQWSDKGYVRCSVTVPVGTCENCGAKSFSEGVDALFDQAFEREYNNLP